MDLQEDKLLRKINLLIADDNEIEIQLIKRVFEYSSFNIHPIIVHDGQEAINYLLNDENRTINNWPDLIILDLNMPNKNGLEALKLIKSNSKRFN